jgi:hypothetical protein
MIFYHRGTALEAITEPKGEKFISRAYILEEDGERTSLGTFGAFRDRKRAKGFAIRYAMAFIDCEPAPTLPTMMRLPDKSAPEAGRTVMPSSSNRRSARSS